MYITFSINIDLGNIFESLISQCESKIKLTVLSYFGTYGHDKVVVNL